MSNMVVPSCITIVRCPSCLAPCKCAAPSESSSATWRAHCLECKNDLAVDALTPTLCTRDVFPGLNSINAKSSVTTDTDASGITKGTPTDVSLNETKKAVNRLVATCIWKAITAGAITRFIPVADTRIQQLLGVDFKDLAEAFHFQNDPRVHWALGPCGGFAHPKDFFEQTFGLDCFVNYIGEVSHVRDCVDILSPPVKMRASHGTPDVTTAFMLKLKIRQQRVLQLSKYLVQKLSFYVNHPAHEHGMAAEAMREFEERISHEAEELKSASNGVELFHVIGYLYCARSQQWLGKEETFLGLGKWKHSIREIFYGLSEDFSLWRMLNQLFDIGTRVEVDASAQRRILPAKNVDSLGDSLLTPEQRADLLQQYDLCILGMIWKLCEADAHGVVCDVCDLVLSGQPLDGTLDLSAAVSVVPKQVLKRRADALLAMGRIFQQMQD